MAAEVIYGKDIANEIKKDLAKNITKLVNEGKGNPCLALIRVGNDDASKVYVRNKVKACNEVGIISMVTELPEETTQEDLEAKILELNNDPDVDGILLQLPLPSHLDERYAIDTIDPDKDVDGLTTINIGRLHSGNPKFIPCTPLGILLIIKRMAESGKPLCSMNAVVLGRSELVGAPIARLLQDCNCTVTICHSKTDEESRNKCLDNADIVISAVGKPKFLNADHIQEGAWVVDVGINRDENGKLCGDVDFDSVKEKAGYITPVPGGVGVMTVTCLLLNTFLAMPMARKEVI